ncbi:CAMP phosphodiesterases class-II:metallo-beta-lactamase-like protein [Dehalogenimonas sp. WBC-2]|nr:CAMP phosphodiesterases class-II:metallo-beta-lactamase-like protein [Dehalogenimonas sp. WBC-2]
MKLRFLGAHNVETASTGLSCLLVDDVVALDAGALTRHLSPSAMFNLQGVLLTHGHYDHIRDVPALGMNLYLNGKTLDLYGNSSTKENLAGCLMNGTIYSKFLEKPPENPTFCFNIIEPDMAFQLGKYEVLAVELPHSLPALGYQMTDAGGKRIFYTGDTGPGLSRCFKSIAPDLMIVEVTASNRFTDFFSSAEGQHLTPELLRRELKTFQRLRGYLPKIACVHMSPGNESEIEAEINDIAAELNSQIYLAREGMTVTI